MREHLRTPALFFYGLTALMLVISVISFVSAIRWINQPFAGFLTYHPPWVGSMGESDWPGAKKDLKYLERIVSADDQPIQRGRDLVDAIKNKKPGTQVRYVIESEGTTREVLVPVSVFSIRDFFLVFFITFLCGLTCYVLGFIVYILKPNTSMSWVFLVLCFSLGTYLVAGFDNQASFYFVFIYCLVTPLVTASLFHLGLVFPDRKRILSRFPAIEYIIYLPALVLGIAFQISFSLYPNILNPDTLKWLPDFKQISSINRIFTIFCVIGMFIFLFHSLFKSSTIMARQRARIIIFGMACAFVPSAIISTLVTFMKVSFPWNFLVFFLIFFPASIAYSIVRHNLFDADTIIRRTVGYFVVTAIVIGAYILVSVAFNIFMGSYQLAQSQIFPIMFTLAVILVFNPLRDRIQALVDRVFFRKEYDYGSIAEKVGGAMTSIMELPQILKHLTQTFIEDMFIDTSSVMLLNSTGTEYQVCLADGERKEKVAKRVFKRDDPLMDIMEGEKKELTKYDLIEDPKFKEVSEPCTADFEELRASLMVPLVYQDKVIGSLNLGEKKSGKPFNREDIELLRTLAHQGAVAIENARLFQENLEKQRMEEELNIARDLQMSMLPAECPIVEGFDIAAYSVSAMEVGGDFYDFIDMGDKKLGFVIGDVTGKSVSGALVMSASRSVFRMLSEEELNVSESMMRANRRLKKDVKSGMFVALLYAVLDAQQKTVTMCSAGQTQPLHLSATTGEANLVETEGDTFPLGILDEANYEDTQIQLSPGDKVLFYTDGIVEAMDKNEEMFGFERLQDVAHSAKSMNADSLLKEILARVNEFVGDAPQHDDLTVIVVSVA